MKLPVVSGKEFVKRLKKIGYGLVGQEGSHTKLSVPNHKELDRGLLRSLIRDADLTVEQFVELKK